MEEELLDIIHDVQVEDSATERRGPKPKVPLDDAVIALIMLYRLGSRLADLGSLIHILPTALHSALERARIALNRTLKKRWWTDRIRPTPLEDTLFPWIGLIVDSTSVEVFHPTARFEEAQTY